MLLERICILLVIGQVVISEVIFRASTHVIYDKTQTLKILGADLNSIAGSAQLELGSINQPLTQNIDYYISRGDSDGLTLTLYGNKSWVDLTGRSPPVTLYLSSVKLSGRNENLVTVPLKIADVLSTPSLTESFQVIDYVCPTFSIFGSGFIGATRAFLDFSPSLVRNVVYDDISRYPLATNQITLRIRPPYHWRDSSGHLTVISIDTGGGAVKPNGNNGVQVAEVVKVATPSMSPSKKPTAHPSSGGVEVFPSIQKVYTSILNQALSINGASMNLIVRLDFSFDLVNGFDYTVYSTTDVWVLLPKYGGKKWPVGPIYVTGIHTSGAVRKVNILVATVLPNPTIEATSVMYHNTQSHLLTLRGSGFTDVTNTVVKLTPTLQESFKIHSVTENVITLQLLDSWLTGHNLFSPYSIALNLVSLDTGAGEIAGSKLLGNKFQTVAYIVPDIEGVSCLDTCVTAFNGVCEDPVATWSNPNKVNGGCRHTDCTDCGGVEALASHQPTIRPTALPTTPSEKPHSNTWFWFLVFTSINLLAAAAGIAWRKNLVPRVVEATNAIELTKYVALPQIESDVSYI